MADAQSKGAPAAQSGGWTRFAPLLIFAVVLAGFVWALQQGGVRVKYDKGQIGKPAPTYALADLDGGEAITPAAFSGKPYLINIFASDCPGCKVEHDLLMDLAKQGAPILGVVYQDEPAKIRAFLAELGDPFARVGLDANSGLALGLGFTGTPETYVVGADGTLMAMHRGALTPEALDGVILPALQR